MSAQAKAEPMVGEMAVEGLYGGIAAGVAMLIFLLASGLLAGETVGAVLSRFSIQAPANPLQGAFVHLAVSATYGVIFGVLRGLVGRRVPVWLLAMVYAAGLYFLAGLVLAGGTGGLGLDWPFALAHGVYGAGLGLWFWRSGRERRGAEEPGRGGKKKG